MLLIDEIIVQNLAAESIFLFTIRCPGDGRCDLNEKNLGKLGICPRNLSDGKEATLGVYRLLLI